MLYPLSLHDALPISRAFRTAGTSCHAGWASVVFACGRAPVADRKSTRLNSSHGSISYAVFCLQKKILLGCGLLMVKVSGLTLPGICLFGSMWLSLSA